MIFIDTVLPKTLKHATPTNYFSLGESKTIGKFFVRTEDLNKVFNFSNENNVPSSVGNYISNDEFNNIVYFIDEVDEHLNINVETFRYGSATENLEIYPLSDDRITLSAMNNNMPIGMRVNKTFPGKKGYTLYDGTYVSYTPNQKHIVAFSFDFLPESTYDKLIGLVDKEVVISPEPISIPKVSPFEGQSFVCQLQNNNLEFDYTIPVKGAGYKGTLTFLES